MGEKRNILHFGNFGVWVLLFVCLFVFMSVGWMGWVMGMGWMDGTFLHFTLFQWGITAILHGTCKGRGKDGRVYSLAHSLTFVMTVWLAGMGWDGMEKSFRGLVLLAWLIRRPILTYIFVYLPAVQIWGSVGRK